MRNSFSFPAASRRRTRTLDFLARSVKPPAWAMACVRVGMLDRQTLRGARILDLAEDIDRDELVDLDVDDVPRLESDVGLGIALVELVDGDGPAGSWSRRRSSAGR